MNWFRRFMTGRYGADQLSIALLFVSLLLSVVFFFIPGTALSYIVYIPLIVFLFRLLSKNIQKRREENIKFLKIWRPVESWFKTKQYRLKDSKSHRYYKCPNCKQTVRVPRKKGKILITCPKCKLEFIKKT